MTFIRIKKGHNINIAGQPAFGIKECISPHSVAIHPNSFRYVKPKLLVKEGERVNLGAPLFFDKLMPEVKWPSPGNGTIKEIRYGSRRVIEKVTIILDEESEVSGEKIYSKDTLSSLNKQEVINHLLMGNLFPFILRRPFNKVANPKELPRDIFVSGYNTSPMLPDLELVLSNQKVEFQAGLDILSCLTDGSVYLTVRNNSDIFSDIKNIKLNTIEGPHPAGNVGIQIHHIAPLNPSDVIWTVEAQHVCLLGKYFLSGHFDPSIIVSIGGPNITNPIHLRSRLGTSIDTIIKDQIKQGDNRIVSGDILTGKESSENGHLGFYHSCVSVVPKSEKRKFLGLFQLGGTDSHYSLTNSFFGKRNKNFYFTTLNNGSERPIVPIGSWEAVLPMDILPNELYRAIVANDLDLMEKLGILECDEEDLALCSFACPSKIDVGGMVRHGLNMIWDEGNK